MILTIQLNVKVKSQNACSFRFIFFFHDLVVWWFTPKQYHAQHSFSSWERCMPTLKYAQLNIEVAGGKNLKEAAF
jgi:hypothetical protein